MRTPLPLSGLVVVELGHSVAGPFAGQVLADRGAEVVKIEKPDGDDARKWGPPFVDGAAAPFQSVNRNKRSVVVDLRDEAQVAELLRFIDERADVVLQNMRPGQVDALGIGAQALRARKPSLVYCNLGAFGSVGPLAERPGYDPLMQAFGGIMSVVGEPGRPPVRVGPAVIDAGAAMWAALGIVAALLHRREAGQAGIVPYRAYRTADGDLVVAAGNDSLFRRLCDAIGEPQWAEDPRFVDNPHRVRNADALYALLENVFASRSNDEWIGVLDAAGVPCAPVQDVGAMLRHPQTEALGMLQRVPGSSIPLIGLPIRFDGARPQPRSAPPSLGSSDLKSLLAQRRHEA